MDHEQLGSNETATIAKIEQGQGTERAPPSSVLQLTAHERTQLENTHLKLRLLEMEYREQRSRLLAQRESVVTEVAGRTGVDLRHGYRIDIETGLCTPAKGDIRGQR